MPESVMNMMPTATTKKFVYARTNEPGGARIVAYERRGYGALREIGRYSTFGEGVPGTIDPLASQASLVLSPDRRWLLSVNGGSNTVSTHRREPDGSLTFGALVSSYPAPNSSTPTSLTVWRDWVYVLNVGNVSSLSGYRADWSTGGLTFVNGSRLVFPGTPGQVLFSPDGRFLLLAGKKADHFRVFPLGSDMLATSATGVLSDTEPGRVPFSMTFDPTGGFVMVALAFGGVGSYALNGDGSMSLVQEYNTSSAATCWIARGSGSDYFFAVNAGKGSISGFVASGNGTFNRVNGRQMLSATTVDQDLYLAPQGAVPLDASVSRDGKYLYVLFGGRGTIAGFAINRQDGTLLPRGETVLQLSGYNGLNGVVAD